MPRPAIDWVITDTHFFHDRMLELCGRPADYNERIIANCRRLLAPQDRLFHLGDVIFYQLNRLKPMLDSVPGTKVLVMGNHDKKSSGWYGRNGFSFVAEAVLVRDIYLTHRPARTVPREARINVHGHFHNMGDRINECPWYDPVRHRLLAIENTRYEPVKLTEFAAEIDKWEHP